MVVAVSACSVAAIVVNGHGYCGKLLLFFKTKCVWQIPLAYQWCYAKHWNHLLHCFGLTWSEDPWLPVCWKQAKKYIFVVISLLVLTTCLMNCLAKKNSATVMCIYLSMQKAHTFSRSFQAYSIICESILWCQMLAASPIKSLSPMPAALKLVSDLSVTYSSDNLSHWRFRCQLGGLIIKLIIGEAMANSRDESMKPN